MAGRARMTGWYDPPRLVSIALRVAVSTVFGEFADRREAVAAARAIDPAALDPACDYRGKAAAGAFWLDFVADTGDGWNSTYAIARLLAAPSLAVAGLGEALPPGRVLIMGGDQVYPTPSRDLYREKLVAPFDAAARQAGAGGGHLYAIPGNHDWYDGLSAFLGLFCARRAATAFGAARRGRLIGGRETRQTRSYFALALPHGWWLWGIDVQLAGYIDQPQVDFFSHVARQWMEPGSRLILCTGQPDWAYVDPADLSRGSFRNFDYIESIARLAHRRHRLCLVLTGDSHHYARYTEAGVNYVTAGGGGAFLHPTHQLADKSFAWPYPPPNQDPGHGGPYRREFAIAAGAAGRPALFPPRRTSRRLAWRNLLFWYFNPAYAATLAFLYAVFAWLLHGNARIAGADLPAFLARGDSFWSGVAGYVSLVAATPWSTILILAAAGGYVYFADFYPARKRLFAGLLHALAQGCAILAASVALARYLPGAEHSWLLILAIGLCSGIVASTVMGAYLLFCLNLFGRHWNEAFSALRIEGFKNFLRLRIAPDGSLTVFPIGLTAVPRDDGGTLRNPPLRPHLIEPPLRLS